jgi:CHASE2 domain-containing sensor protein
MTRGRVVLLAGLAGALAMLGAGRLPVADRLEQATVDVRFAVRGTQPVSGLAVVAIDEKTFSALKPTWPFRRTLHARMLDRLRRSGVRQVVYDVQFTEPSDRPDDDLALYDAVARTGHVILATGESDGRGGTRVLGGEASLAEAGGAKAAASTFPHESGGVIRRYQPVDTGLETIPAMTARRLGAAHVQPGLIDFRGPPGTIPTYSFSDVLSGRVGAAQLRGLTVVVGATAPVLQDVHPTSAPGERMMPGPEIEANAIWTAVHGNPLREVAGWVGVLLALGLAGLATLAVRALGPVRGPAVAVLLAGAYAAAAQLAFDHGSVLPVVVPLGSLAAALALAIPAAAAAEIAARARATRHNAELESAVRERTSELADTQLELVRRLARAAELRDDDTGDHIERMSGLCREVALELGMSPDEADLIRHASALHDVGKIGVPDGILLKPGRLTDAEMTIMRRHVLDGARLLSGSDSILLQLAEVIVRTHHERWDGTGYPAGIAGERIPLEGRIAAVCDVFDALVSDRPYKKAWSVEDALAEIDRGRGAHFDPRVADALLAVVARRTGIHPPAAMSDGPVAEPLIRAASIS